MERKMYQSQIPSTYILCLTLLLSLTPIFSSSTGFSEEIVPIIDMKNLVKHYVPVCGHEWLCNPLHFGFSSTDTTQLINNKTCPFCSCDYNCVILGNCCPDVYFMVPAPNCKSTVLQDTANPSSKTKVSMIDTCSIFNDDDVKSKCEKNYTTLELFENPPVTSTMYAYTFVNKYCAKCNNVTDYKSWNLNITCVIFKDFNFLSSYSEIMELAKQNDCLIEYSITTGVYKPCGKTSIVTTRDADKPCKALNEELPPLISFCNTTGHWMNYDQDIALACEYSDYNVRYRNYKNIFCRMCNPIPQTDSNDIITECNVTGAWNKYEKNLEYACGHQEQTSATFPFKNVYCHLCNKNNSDSRQFVDAPGTFVVKTYSDHIHYKISLNNYNTLYYRNLLNEDRLSNFIKFKEKRIQRRVDIKNMTNVLMKDYSTEGVYRYCDENLTSLVFVRSNCSCKPQCFFEKDGTCCVETALEFPISCYSNLFLSGNTRQKYGYYIESSYAMVDGCYNVETKNTIKHRCENPSNRDIFSMMPVLDPSNNIIYRNFDCLICNQPGFNVADPLHQLDSLSFRTWDLEIYCHVDLNADFHLIVGDLIKLAIRHGCIVAVSSNNEQTYSIQRSSFYCEITENPNINDKCNVSGNWFDFDRDLQEACENSGPFLPVYERNYKNVFCFLCNPPQRSVDVIPKTCIVTDITINGEEMLEACKIFPFIQHKLPFKNIFCEHCELHLPFTLERNSPISPYTQATENQHIVLCSLESNYRVFFGENKLLQSFNNRKTVSISVISSSEEKIFDAMTMTHRNVTCYPGKRLIGSSCIPLLKKTNHLRYIFAIALDGEFGSRIFLKILLRYFKDIIKEHHGVKFDSFYIVSDLPCYHFNADSNGTSTHLLLHTTFRVVSFVDRLDFEEKLHNMSIMNHTVSGHTYIASVDQQAFLVPSFIHQIDNDKNCFILRLKKRKYISEKNYRSTIVSRLMLCRQIELDVHEFDVNDTKIELTVTEGKSVFGFGEFYMTKMGNARICVEDFLKIRSELVSGPQVDALQGNEDKKALGLITLVCTIVSLTCLLLTFVTYVLFKSLRSIPGINNMCLVISMFFAMALFQFGYQQTNAKIACKIIGIFLHFFWLSTFGCMSMCSYHMYRVFTNLSRISNGSRKTILYYMLFAYGIPTVIICVNVTIIASTNNKKSIGYGGEACFVSNRISFFLTFLSPVVIVCFTNIFFFVRTTLCIRSKPNLAKNRENRNDFVIYVKLFSITGITWLLVIIDTFFPLSAFSYIVTILNACQGMFIFVSFVCNKRVMSLYKNAAKCRDDSASSNVTKSTQARNIEVQ